MTRHDPIPWDARMRFNVPAGLVAHPNPPAHVPDPAPVLTAIEARLVRQHQADEWQAIAVYADGLLSEPQLRGVR